MNNTMPAAPKNTVRANQSNAIALAIEEALGSTKGAWLRNTGKSTTELTVAFGLTNDMGVTISTWIADTLAK